MSDSVDRDTSPLKAKACDVQRRYPNKEMAYHVFWDEIKNDKWMLKQLLAPIWRDVVSLRYDQLTEAPYIPYVPKPLTEYQIRKKEEKAAAEDARYKAVMQKCRDGMNRAFDEIREEAVENYKRSVLFKFRINGRPIGECTPSEALDWADATQANLEFVTVLLSGVHHADGRVIKDILAPDEADVVWEKTHPGQTGHAVAA